MYCCEYCHHRCCSFEADQEHNASEGQAFVTIVVNTALMIVVHLLLSKSECCHGTTRPKDNRLSRTQTETDVREQKAIVTPTSARNGGKAGSWLEAGLLLAYCGFVAGTYVICCWPLTSFLLLVLLLEQGNGEQRVRRTTVLSVLLRILSSLLLLIYC